LPLAAISADTSQSERNPYSAIGGYGLPLSVGGLECELTASLSVTGHSLARNLGICHPARICLTPYFAFP
jgi:hypothetical protein